MLLDESLREQVANLDDVFLNADLVRSLMADAPIETPSTHPLLQWSASRRGRLERLWWTMLNVLVEMWERRPELRAALSAWSSGKRVDELVSGLKDSGLREKLRETRDYMCHRDKREYWDEGRLAPVGALQQGLALHSAFAAMLSEARQAITRP